LDLSIFALDYTGFPAAPGGLILHGSGFTDPEYFPTIAYVVQEGAPSSQAHTVFAFNPRVTLPVGTYDTNNLVNAGQHRVVFKPQISVAQRFAKAFTAEIVANIAIHSENSKFVIPNPTMMGPALINTAMTQNPDLFIDAHLGADLSKTFFLGASYYYAKNGKKTLSDLGDIVAAKAYSVSALRFSLGIRIEKNTLAMIQVEQQFAASAGEPVDRFAGIRLSHVFFEEPEPSVPEPRREAPAPPPPQNPDPDAPL
jgi:hypothetical protein